MLQVDSGRVNDPETLSPIEIAEACAQRERLVVQFSRPEAYGPAILQSLNEACRLAGNRLQVRFYGHYSARFDAVVLRHLPDVRDLAVDCLTEIVHEEEIGRLPVLKRLSFGVFKLNRPDFLDTLDLGPLERLVLIENEKRNIDLSSLAKCGSLTELFVHGHAKGIDVLAGLPGLRKLTLGSHAKKHPLGFIPAMPALTEMTLILGGRDAIDDLSSTTLEMLQILRVRGLATLGDLSRLPSLSALRIEDQLQLTTLDLSGAKLERLALFNCRKLADLPGLDGQDRLREFRASGVALDLNALRDRDWPPATRSVGLSSGSMKWNDDARARLAARGFDEKAGYWP
ncbi:hypothetical protein BLA6860_01149 [Burkholderia lata]|uniref:hypothetical protein n=1 Tax=Burkholderia lata (strain ATCC 17760 / DSM 23089 / LMG 22485 / NCIMB 9086 / R18194 / 383) TaxID=482957 RepID=UPI001452EE41|nr:hypothetical protein [Burkholderia lata]VWB27554.1 hypothetical protein BLA6860_01149 [Burkholderia lata]